MLKKRLIVILLIFVVCMITMTGISQAAEAKYKIKLAGIHPEDHIVTQTLRNIKENVERESNGDIEITIYPGNQLGDYTAVYEELMRGSIEMAHICQTGQYDEKFEMNYMPYLITDYDQIPKVFSPGSYFYDKYAELNKNQGVKLLGIYTEGFPGVAMRDTIPKGVADPKVKKSELVRVPPMDIINIALQDMGYNTVTIPYSDLFSALQTGVADGWFGGTAELNYLGFRDVIKYFIPYHEHLENTSYLMNQKFFDSLPEKYQKLIESECMKAAQESFKTCEEQDKLFLQKLADFGIVIVDLSDEQRVAVAEHVRKTTWPKLVNKLGNEVLEGLKSDIE